MTPLIFSNDPAVALRSRAVVQKKAIGMTRLACEPWADTAKSARDIATYWSSCGDMPRAVSLGFVGVNGFDVDRRDSNGVLIGCSQADYDAGVAAGVMPHARDAQKVKIAADIWKAAATAWMPDIIHVDIEPQTLPTVAPDRFDWLRCQTVYAILTEASLFTSTKHVVVEFTAFGDPKSYACNGDGVRVPIMRTRPRFRSTSEFYSTAQTGANNPLVTAKLAAWLGGVTYPAFPWVDVLNQNHTDDALALCQQHNATAMFWIDDGLGGKGIGAETQAEWASQAIDRSRQ